MRSCIVVEGDFQLLIKVYTVSAACTIPSVEAAAVKVYSFQDPLCMNTRSFIE